MVPLENVNNLFGYKAFTSRLKLLSNHSKEYHIEMAAKLKKRALADYHTSSSQYQDESASDAGKLKVILRCYYLALIYVVPFYLLSV